MKQITFIRHAKVDCDNSQEIGSSSLKKWVQTYDTAPIDPHSLPHKETVALVQVADVVVTSTLRRTHDSAEVMGVNIYEQNKLFNEAAIPEVHIPYLKLKPKSWLVILRLMLLFGLGKKDSSLRASKAQAKEGVQRLLELSEEHDNIVLVGHGGMNYLLGKELVREGWMLEGKRSHENWGTTVFKNHSSLQPKEAGN